MILSLVNQHATNFPIFCKSDLNNRVIELFLQYQPIELVDYIQDCDFQYSNITDEELIFLIDNLPKSRDVYSLQKFDLGKTHQKFHIFS